MVILKLKFVMLENCIAELLNM